MKIVPILTSWGLFSGPRFIFLPVGMPGAYEVMPERQRTAEEIRRAAAQQEYQYQLSLIHI